MTKTISFTHNGKRYRARYLKRPFREGSEVLVKVGDETLRIAELGLGEEALIEKLRAEIDRLLKAGTAP